MSELAARSKKNRQDWDRAVSSADIDKMQDAFDEYEDMPGASPLKVAARSSVLLRAQIDAGRTGRSGSVLAVGAAAGMQLGMAAITVQFGKVPKQVSHTFRHIPDLDQGAVKSAITTEVKAIASQIAPGQPFNRIIDVGGVRLQYTAYKLSDGTINIGRIHAAP
jgi:hypothetical protein